MQRFSFLKQLGLLSAAVGLLATTEAAAQTAFTPGNYVVARVGDGTAALSAVATATFLLEYTPTGTLVRTLALPTADAGTTLALTETGSSSTDASLTRSADGRYLILPGYNAAAGTAALAATTSAATNRIIGRIAADGTINTTTRINDAFSGGNIRGAASANGSSFYAVGSTSGVIYAPLGNAGASTTISTGTPTNNRSVNIFGGNLYISSASAGTYGVLQVGTGLPTTTSQALTLLPGFPTASGPSPYSFFFADLSTAVAGVDVVYVADDAAGIQKWSLVSGTWVQNGIIGPATAAVRGITGSVSATGVSLMATSAASLYAVTDNAGYNAAPSVTTLPTALATAGTNMAFRSIAPAPLATALAARAASTQELGLYPNPATDMLTVELPGTPALGHTAELRDLLGRPVRTATLPASGQFSLSGLRAGTYLLTVDGSLTRRITKAE